MALRAVTAESTERPLGRARSQALVVNFFNLHNGPIRPCYYYLHFADEETEV